MIILGTSFPHSLLRNQPAKPLGLPVQLQRPGHVATGWPSPAGSGLRFWGLGFRVWGLGFGVWGLGFRESGIT